MIAKVKPVDAVPDVIQDYKGKLPMTAGAGSQKLSKRPDFQSHTGGDFLPPTAFWNAPASWARSAAAALFSKAATLE